MFCNLLNGFLVYDEKFMSFGIDIKELKNQYQRRINQIIYSPCKTKADMTDLHIHNNFIIENSNG